MVVFVQHSVDSTSLISPLKPFKPMREYREVFTLKHYAGGCSYYLKPSPLDYWSQGSVCNATFLLCQSIEQIYTWFVSTSSLSSFFSPLLLHTNLLFPSNLFFACTFNAYQHSKDNLSSACCQFIEISLILSDFYPICKSPRRIKMSSDYRLFSYFGM